MLIPALTIGISYLVVEPFPKLTPIPEGRILAAALAWLRLAGMTLLSVSWMRSITVGDLAQLANALGVGQYLFSVSLMTASAFRLAAARWKGLREMLCLQRPGLLAQRKKVQLAMAAPIGLQLTLASLVMTTDTALAAQGRGIGRRRAIAMRAPRPTFAGMGLIAGSLVLALLPYWTNPDAWFR